MYERMIIIENIISVKENKCKQCYSCVRNCPVKAIQIKNGQAEIMFSRCINCGICITSCPQNAKIVIDSICESLEILNGNNKVIACLAPSFITSSYPYTYKKVIGALKKIGFDEVWEVAVGAEALTQSISKFIKENDQKVYLSSACPSIVSMIEKHYPELIKYLLPFVSPMIATGKIIRKKYSDEKIKIIFIGPCVAKKAEIISPKLEGIIDCVLTFDEIKKIIIDKGISINSIKESEFDGIPTNEGKLFPLSGGLLKNLSSLNKIDGSYISVEGEEDISKLIDALQNGHHPFKFVDILMCKGCIEGPKIDSTFNYYDKINIINEFYKDTKKCNNIIEYDIDLTREYRNRRNILPFPSEDEIRKVLRSTNKYTEADELNCGACGYSTCREKAIAVVQGIAEVDMCLPYLLSKKNDLLEMLSAKLEEITLLKDELETIIESSYDGLVITDSEGRILKSNNSINKMLEINNEENKMEDMNIINLPDKKIMFPSTTMLALKEKRRISFFQNSESGKKYLSTATPIFDIEGNISRVVTNIRDIDKLNKLRDQIEETKKLEKYHLMNENEKQIDNINIKKDNIVANSKELGNVLQIAGNVATVDSTILITGESGVGKEVVVKFIHRLSKRKSKPFIKINCGAIPENLIESELFGYESGAFTGAQKKGKPGLIELANEGTLFLDEIGELPLNVQVKFLRVIQEKKLIRIGGTIEKNVDVRIIAATNRNLYDMVNKGTFRVDLYYRLNVVPIEIPPLRKRQSDILPLCYHFLRIFNTKYKCSKDITTSVENILYNYDWPGNVRELENLTERLVVTVNKEIIDENDLPLFLFNTNFTSKEIKIDKIMHLKEAREIVDKVLIEKAYKKYKTTYEMAEALGVNQSTIVRKLQKYLNFNALEHN